MNYSDYSEMSDRQVLVSLSQKVDGIREDMKSVKSTQEEIQDTQEEFDDRLEKAEEITDNVHRAKRWTFSAIGWGIILALAGLLSSTTSFFRWEHLKTLFGLIK